MRVFQGTALQREAWKMVEGVAVLLTRAIVSWEWRKEKKKRESVGLQGGDQS